MNERYTITTDISELLVKEDSTLGSISQDVAIVLATAYGSVPGYRDFGCPQEFLDLPLPAAQVAMVNPIREAIEKYEPRVTVTSVRFQYKDDRLKPIVDIKINEGVEVEI